MSPAAALSLLRVQISTFSQMLAKAVSLLLERKALCELWPKPGCQKPYLSSPLMLRWAPHIKHASFSVQCTDYPGIRAFMAAASCLRQAHILYPKQYMSKGSLVRSTTSSLYCCEAPNREMQRRLSKAVKAAPQEKVLWISVSLSEQLEALLLTSAGMPSLRRLVIRTMDMTELQSTVMLPPLVEVQVFMATNTCRPLQLRWLRLQSSSTISMHIRVYQQTPSQALQAVSELQTLQIHVLHLETRNTHFPAEIQQIWGQLRCCEQLHLRFWGHHGSVHALPNCELAMISGPSKPSRSFHFRWQAVECRLGRVVISLHKSQSLRVMGYAELPASCARPWQLVVRSAAGVKGLPPSRATEEAYLLQNAAADAAGWQSACPSKNRVPCPCKYSVNARGKYGSYGLCVPW